MSNFKNRMAGFMYGRRGVDELGRLTILAALIFMALEMILKKDIFYYLSLLLLLYYIFRAMSRNISKRYQENQKYLAFRNRIIHPKKNKKAQNAYTASDAANYRYFNCPGCNQKMRAPKGRGRIRVTCSKCGKKFETEV